MNVKCVGWLRTGNVASFPEKAPEIVSLQAEIDAGHMPKQVACNPGAIAYHDMRDGSF